jgi:protein TonB
VTDVIVARARDAERLQPMVLWSVGAHAVLLVAVVLLPMLTEPAQPRARMTVILNAGAPGPESGGLTPIGGRQIQQAAPVEAPRLEPPVPPPPPPEPKMVVPPEPKPEPKPAPRPETRKPVVPKEPPPAVNPTRAARATPPSKPSTGEEVREGNTSATREPGTGFGLSSGGSGASGSVQLDVTDFCCPEYIERMKTQIERYWDRNQDRRGASVVRFTILRDGTVERVSIGESSGSYPLDNAAQRAVLLAGQLPRLPEEFPNPTLTVHLTFRY